MAKKQNKILIWLPRILAILYILFVSMFALDVFEEKQWFLALIMHLIPSYVLIIMTMVAWKNRKLGGILFLILGLIFTGIMIINTNYYSLVISVPVIVIGGLFLIKVKKIYP